MIEKDSVLRITIKDIASHCGVSSATVSLVLSDKPNRISEVTRRKILQAAEEMNYQPNRAAVSLATKRSRIIGLIINDLRNSHIASLFMAIDQVVQKNGYSLACHILNQDDVQRQSRQLASEIFSLNVEAIIWGRPYNDLENRDGFLLGDYLDRVGVPIATMDDYGLSCPGIDVIFDYFQGGYLATKHLIEYGHRRIGCVSGPPHFKVSRQRLEGYRKALLEHGIPYNESLIYFGDYDMESGSRSLSYLLGQKATAIFSFNDQMAFGIYQAARQYNLNIPGDISLIGFDNVPFGNVMEVPLTTIHVPVDAMGRTIGERIVEIVDGQDVNERLHVEYEPTLLVRGSTRSIT